MVDQFGNIHGKNFQVFRSENKTKSNKLTNLKLLEDLKKDLPRYKSELDKSINKTDEHVENLATTKKEVKLLSEKKFNLIEDSWGKSSCTDGKLQVCAKTCGLNDAFAQQYI